MLFSRENKKKKNDKTKSASSDTHKAIVDVQRQKELSQMTEMINHKDNTSNMSNMSNMDNNGNMGTQAATEFINNSVSDKVTNNSVSNQTEIIGVTKPLIDNNKKDRTEIIGLSNHNDIHITPEATELCNAKATNQVKTELCIDDKSNNEEKTEMSISSNPSKARTEIADNTPCDNATDLNKRTDSSQQIIEVAKDSNLEKRKSENASLEKNENVNIEKKKNGNANVENKKSDSTNADNKQNDSVEEAKQAKPVKTIQKSSFILRLLDKENGGRVFEKIITDVLVIGRKSELCDLAISYDKTVSSRQCKVFIKRRNLYVVNLSDTNITYLNGKPLTDEAPLSSGDVLSLGRVNLRVTVMKNK